jgi:hypothetical protein
MSYLLRVTPPAAIKQLAQEFDDVVLETATRLLDLEGEVNSQQYKDHFSLVQSEWWFWYDLCSCKLTHLLSLISC